jgi:hypothetical protein
LKHPILALAALVLAIPCAANAMDVATWLAKADALDAKGVGALLSKDYKLLETEIRSNAALLKSEREAAKAAGKRPAYCPPGKVALKSSEIIAMMRAIPEAQRARTPVKDALRAGLGRKYPCP